MVCGLVVLAAPALDSQSTGSLMQGWLTLQPGVKSLRISSFDKSGGNNDRLEKIAQGERRTLADIKGAGQITHIWVTIAPPPPAVSRHDIILRMYWDDETTPSVEAPIGEFFGQGWNESYPMASLPLAAGPREGRAMVSYFPMPFRSRARIEVENDTGRQIDAFYYYVDYEQFQAGALPADTPYFHAWYHHELTEAQTYGENEWNTLGPEQKNTTGAGNFLVADITGRGHYVGMNYYVHSPSPMWYGEGDDLFQVDGEPGPGSLHGTGTEDYFNTSWSPEQPVPASVLRLRARQRRDRLARPHPRLPLPPDRPGAIPEITAGVDRARPRQQPHARPRDRGVLVPGRAAQGVPRLPRSRIAQADAQHRPERDPPLARRVAQADGQRPEAVGEREETAVTNAERRTLNSRRLKSNRVTKVDASA